MGGLFEVMSILELGIADDLTGLAFHCATRVPKSWLDWLCGQVNGVQEM